MNRFTGMLFALACVVMVACSNLTPNQAYRADFVVFLAADAGLTTGLNSGRIPESAKPEIVADLTVAGTNLSAFNQWCQDNPKLADTVGYMPQERMNADPAVQALQVLLTKYALVAPLPPAPVTTRP